MINFLYNSIINYKAVHKPIFIENYVQSNNNRKVDKMFLLTSDINKIVLYVVSIEVYFYFHPAFDPGHPNIPKSVLFIKQLAIG